MSSLDDLIKRDGIRARWFWTHEVSTGPYTEYEVWDLVLIRPTDDPALYVTDGNTRRTAYFQGISGSEADSRRNNGGRHVNPALADALAELLMDASRVEELPSIKDWLQEALEAGAYTSYDEIEVQYTAAVETRAQLMRFLGDSYEEYRLAWT